MVLEKEKACGLHASSRNSGVLHAGFYYTPESVKARLTREGNKAMREYCEENSIAINACGKLVVARGPADLAGLKTLLLRGRVNGVTLEMLSEAESRKIEPRVLTYEKAIYSPSTATVDPVVVMAALADDAKREGVLIRAGEGYRRKIPGGVETSQGTISAGFVVNAAGLYADRIARDFGFSEKYRILPFKGIYLYSREPAGALRTNVYPVPDLDYPFLGVHFTLTAQGKSKIGPTAIPALWREQYAGWEGFSAGEFMEIALRQLGLLASSSMGFRKIAFAELMKYHRPRLVSLASGLLSGVRLEDYQEWGPAGIRAQLMDVTNGTLVMDFILEGDSGSLHVLNAVSPGFTCAFPFARMVCDQIESKPTAF